MLFGRLALFMAGALAGVVMHSSWETHRRRSDRSDGSFAWQAIIEKEKEVKKDLDVVQVGCFIHSIENILMDGRHQQDATLPTSHWAQQKLLKSLHLRSFGISFGIGTPRCCQLKTVFRILARRYSQIRF